MKNNMKRIVSLVLALAFLFILAGCGNANTAKKIENDGSKPAETDFGTVWSAPSTVKITQAGEGFVKGGNAALVYNAVRNEYESVQLLISATKAIENFSLEVSDLKSGENIFSAENITVYKQHYSTVKSSQLGTVRMPDALIPQHLAAAKNEMKIAEGNTGGLWVTVYIPKDTVPGTYEGAFTLCVDGDEMEIPVQIAVNNYTLPDTTTGQTLFSWRYDRVGAGELDSSIDMMTEYYEFFLDYRISLQSMPLESLNEQEVIDCAERYYETTTTITLLSDIGDVSTGLQNRIPELKTQVRALASISSTERNYFDKVMLYTIDEPVVSSAPHLADTINRLTKIQNALVEVADEIEADTTGKYDTFKQIENWREWVEDIPNVTPLAMYSADYLIKNWRSEEMAAYLEVANCICPELDALAEEYQAELWAMLEAYPHIKLWWYGCVNPGVPYPTYHIGDANLLSARTLSWVQKQYGILGNLYWDAAAYTTEGETYNQYIDVYLDSRRGPGWPAGDGNLAYPGAAYDHYGPLPSIRLMSIRDGMEEFEMLTDIEKYCQQLELTYGEEIDAQIILDQLCEQVAYNGSSVYAEGENGLNFTRLRSELLNMLDLMAEETGFLLHRSTVSGSSATVTFYAADGSKVYGGGKLLTPVEGNRYAYTIDLGVDSSLYLKLELADGSTYEIDRYIGEPVFFLQGLDTEESAATITGNDTTVITFVEDADNTSDGKGIKIELNGKITGNMLEDAMYVPYVAINVNNLESIQSLSELSALTFDVHNPGAEFEAKLRIYSGTTFVDVKNVKLGTGATTVKIDLNGVAFSGIATADRITLEFINSDDQVTPNAYTFYIDNILGSK